MEKWMTQHCIFAVEMCITTNSVITVQRSFSINGNKGKVVL